MSLVSVELSGLDMMQALVLPNGKRWGEIAADFQIEDAAAVFSNRPPHLHFLTRPRGGSKTTDIAGVALSWLAVEAPKMARGYVIASNESQGALTIDAAARFCANTDALHGEIEVQGTRILNPKTGAWVSVLAASDSGAWGLMEAHLLVLDEFAQWPETRGAKRVWDAINTTVIKTPGCRLVILTSAGEPSHWSYEEVFKPALDDPDWRVHEVPGPVPWQSERERERLKRQYANRMSVYERLILNRWTSAEEHPITPEMYEAAAVRPARNGRGRRISQPVKATRYVLTLDIGLVNDATVFCVAHLGEREGDPHVVVDHLERWRGTRRAKLQLTPIRQRVAELAKEWNSARVYADPYQAVGIVQDLRREGVHAEEWNFTGTSVGQVASALVLSMGNEQINFPDSPELREELLNLRLREQTVGVARLDHAKGGHDDQAVVIGLAAHLLLGKRLGSAKAFFSMVEDGREETKRRRGAAERLVRARPRYGDTGRAERLAARCQHRWRQMADGSEVCVMGCGTTRNQASA